MLSLRKVKRCLNIIDNVIILLLFSSSYHSTCLPLVSFAHKQPHDQVFLEFLLVKELVVAGFWDLKKKLRVSKISSTPRGRHFYQKAALINPPS